MSSLHCAERVANAFGYMVSKHPDLKALSEQILRFWIQVFKAEAGLITVVREGELELTASLHIRDPEFVNKSSHVAEALKIGFNFGFHKGQAFVQNGSIPSFVIWILTFGISPVGLAPSQPLNLLPTQS